jgi:predicted lactoylglutathione lyase
MLTVARYGTKNLERATKFYDAIAELLNARRVMEINNAVCYQGPEGGMFIIGLPFQGEATSGNGVQISFAASNRAVVDKAHALALKLGGKDEGPPGVRGDELSGFYAAYFRDLDGNKLMVFHMKQ